MMHLCMLADSGLMRDLQQHVFSHGGQSMFRLPRSRPSAKGAPSGPFRIWSFGGQNEVLQYSHECCKVFCGMAICGSTKLIIWT